MRRLATIILAVCGFGCATSSLDGIVTARIESHGGYVVYGVLPTHRYSAHQIPCKLDARLGTHFFLEVPRGEKGRISIVNKWTRIPLTDSESNRSERLGREVRRFKFPFTDRTGTFLMLTLNEEADLFPARYEQVVSTSSGRVLFRHQFTIPECSTAP